MMEISLTSAAFVVAAVCVGLMGYAVQRGATCTVAAMDEVVRKRGFNRLTSMLEASIWVAGGLVIAQALHLLPKMPAGYGLTYVTVLGGVLLGLGAYVNKACVFGAIARLGSGEWAYAVTPVGFYAGCVTFATVFPFASQQRLPHDSPILQASTWIALPFVAFVVWRLVRPMFATPVAGASGSRWRDLASALGARVWAPHAATTVIGVTFVVVLLLVGGTWAYTDVLNDLARGMANNLVARNLLLLVLFAGAMLGGWTAGRFRSTPISIAQVLKCFTGGMLMGWGSLLIPGSNDGLILIGIPLLRPYAWVAFLTMCVTIGIALVLEKMAAGHGVEQAVH